MFDKISYVIFLIILSLLTSLYTILRLNLYRFNSISVTVLVVICAACFANYIKGNDNESK